MPAASTFSRLSRASWGTVRLCAVVWWTLGLLLVAGCSPTKHLSPNELLLERVRLTCDDPHVKPSDYRPYVRQEANTKWFSLAKVPLAIYNLSGSDSTRRWNRFVRRLGEAPVSYDSLLMQQSSAALTAALKSRGYLHAEVRTDTIVKGRKTTVNYRMHPGERYYVEAVRYDFDNDTLREAVLRDSLHTLLHKGIPLSATILSDERNRILRSLRRDGFYHLNKEYLSFSADTARSSCAVTLTLHFRRPEGTTVPDDYHRFRMGSVRLYENVLPLDTGIRHTRYREIDFYHKDRIRIYRRVYNRHIHLRKDSLYREDWVQDTYSALNALSAVNYSTIRFKVSDSIPHALDAAIYVETRKPRTIGFELEGTNTSGNLGAAVALTYGNNNLFGGSENLTVKLRGAYEAIRGLEGYSGQDYVELSGEATLQFPILRFPLVPDAVKWKLQAASTLSLLCNSQDRPEFHRRILTAGWGYRWHHSERPNRRHRLDLISINYVFMPWISETFRNEYLEGDDPHYAILRYSYENLLIMNMAYAYHYNSRGTGGGTAASASPAMAGTTPSDGYQLKWSVETAGNLLYGLSRLVHAERDAQGRYNVLGIAYSQYAKFDFDFARSIAIDDRNAIAFHAAFGIAIPYGNSSIVPYEKRYFSGGANSVRGWRARELGPGSYKGQDGRIDFINQTGNLRLDLSVEYRTRLFWKFHGAAFIDAGNVWDTRHYADRPGGQFRWNSFARQIAVSYGIGLRFNLDYFVLRFDGGMKAINPAYTAARQHYPLLHPDFSRDFTFHFAVGLPF